MWEALELSGPLAGDTGLPRALSQFVPALRVGAGTCPICLPCLCRHSFVCGNFQPSAAQNNLVGVFVLFPGTLRKDCAGLLALDDSKKPNKYSRMTSAEAALYSRVTPSWLSHQLPWGHHQDRSSVTRRFHNCADHFLTDSGQAIQHLQISADFCGKQQCSFCTLSALSCQIETSHSGMFFFQ